MISIDEVHDKKSQMDEVDIVPYMSMMNGKQVPTPFTIQRVYPDVSFTFMGDCQCLPGVICIEHVRKRETLHDLDGYYDVQMKELQKKCRVTNMMTGHDAIMMNNWWHGHATMPDHVSKYLLLSAIHFFEFVFYPAYLSYM